ncbi:MAG: Fic family protein [Actinomycetota bacterium]|nr:Fic family protein [Actinomycetota bacterium]MDQ2956860.1 Fic family protein [Actinomycetota bacterium]
MAQRGRPSRETIFARFAAGLDELRQYGGLPTPAEAGSIWDDIWHLEAHNSTAIEGNTLVLREVEQLLDQGRAVGAKPLKDYLEVRGYGDAAGWVYAQARGAGPYDASGAGSLVSVTEIREVHRLAMAPVWEVAPHPDATSAEAPGGFREHDLRPFAGGMVPPPWPDVSAQLTTWVDTVNAVGADITAGRVDPAAVPLELARIHTQFEKIHPFIDGNGRTGRLVLNLVLVRLGFPPAIIFKRERESYLKGLDQADNGDPGRLAEQIARSVIDNLHRLVVPNIAGPSRTVPLRSLVSGDLSFEALRQAARRGALQAHQGSDGIWRSTGHEVDRYRKNRHRRQC